MPFSRTLLQTRRGRDSDLKDEQAHQLDNHEGRMGRDPGESGGKVASLQGFGTEKARQVHFRP